ncbi:MAG TPA: metallophosphoesterase [Polyangiaceae bacterium]|jgi:predicted phosphodiesterase
MRTIVLGDLHLATHAPPAVGRDLVTLLGRHRGDRVVFAGDFFDTTGDGFEPHPHVRRALAEHAEAGGELVWIAGNHDSELSDVARGIGVHGEAAARVRRTPWFFREGGLHVEHGHLFDPDNAPAHPLASSRGTLGVHFVEEFIAKTGAFHYLNANDKTPLELLVDAFRWYGRRGPHVVYTYFRAAFSALGKSGRFWSGEADAARAEAGLAAFLEDAGLDEPTVRELMNEHAAPTMRSLRDTVARLYLDRVTATVAVLAGMSALALGRRRLALVLGLGGIAGLAFSWSRGHDRYGGKVPARLDEGARRVARTTGAKLVVFGHTHELADREGYSNTASFAFPRGTPGRPYLEIENERAIRRFFAA